jgi:hypothetical protein
MTSKLLEPSPTFGNSPQPVKVRRSTHVIANVHWPQGVRPEEYDGCPIECACGWSGVVGEWLAHRTGQA